MFTSVSSIFTRAHTCGGGSASLLSGEAQGILGIPICDVTVMWGFPRRPFAIGLRANRHNRIYIFVEHFKTMVGRGKRPHSPASADEEEDTDFDITPSMFMGNAGEQTIAYIMSLLKRESLSKKRAKGKAPSSEHRSHSGKTKAPRLPDPNKSLEDDPTYLPPPPLPKKGDKTKGRGRGRGQGQGQGRGRGRGRGAKNVSVAGTSMNSTKGTPKKAEHWRPNELTALVNGCNHLKPVLKGRFKHSTDGVTMKTLAWEELCDYVNANGGQIKRSVKQCQDKIAYSCQKAKKKRQLIDSNYPTGSGRRAEEDYLSELEQGCCDYAGEEVTLGIPGMQPPNLKGGARSDAPWSCYDPNRQTRVDYAAIPMPSAAMTKTLDGQLIESIDGVAVLDEQEQPEEVEEYGAQGGTEVEEDGQYDDADDEVAQDIEDEGDDYYEDESETQSQSEVLFEKEDPITARISRADMLKICGNFNEQLRLATNKKLPRGETAANILLCTDKSQKTKESLLAAALKNVQKVETKSITKKTETQVKSKAATYKPDVEDTGKDPHHSKVSDKTKLRKTPSFSKLINESMLELHSPPDSPDPQKVELKPNMYMNQEKAKAKTVTYTQEEVNAMLLSMQPFLKQQPSQQLDPFSTSTPSKAPSPISKQKSRALKQETPIRVSPRLHTAAANSTAPRELNKSAIDEMKSVASSSKKSLFKESKGTKDLKAVVEVEPDESLETIPPASPLAQSLDGSINDDIRRADLNIEHGQLLTDHRAALNAAQAKIEEDVSKTHANLTSCAQKVSGAVILVQARLAASSKEISQTVITAHTDIAQSTNDLAASINKTMRDNMTEMAESLTATFKQEGQTLAKDMAEIVKKSGEDYLATQEKTFERYDEATDAVTAVHEKLVEHIVKKEVKLVTGLTRVAEAVVVASEKIEKSHQIMLTGMVSMADGMAKMANNMSKLLDTNEALRKSQEASIKTLSAADKALAKMVENLQTLSEAQETMNKESIARALLQMNPHVQCTAEGDKVLPSGEMSTLNTYHSHIPNIAQSTTLGNLQMRDPTTSAYLTHPDPPLENEPPTYMADNKIDRLSGTFLKETGTADRTYALPGSVQDAVPFAEVTEHAEEPEADHVSIMRNLQNAGGSDIDTDGTVSDRGEGAGDRGDGGEENSRPPLKRSSRVRNKKNI